MNKRQRKKNFKKYLDEMTASEGYKRMILDFKDLNQLELTVKDNGTFKKHYLGLSDNVTYFVEQIDSALVSDGRYKVIFKPSVIVPYIEVK